MSREYTHQSYMPTYPPMKMDRRTFLIASAVFIASCAVPEQPPTLQELNAIATQTTAESFASVIPYKPYQLRIGRTPIPGNFAQCVTNFQGGQPIIHIDTSAILVSNSFAPPKRVATALIARHESIHCQAGRAQTNIVFGTDLVTNRLITGTYAHGFTIYTNRADALARKRPLTSSFDEAFAHVAADAVGLFKEPKAGSAVYAEVGGRILQELTKRGRFDQVKALAFYREGKVVDALKLMSRDDKLTDAQMIDILGIFESLLPIPVTDARSIENIADQIMKLTDANR